MMNKAQKQVQNKHLQNEKATVEAITKAYESALRDIKAKIKELSADELTQSKVYQIEYQKALQGQVETIIDNMKSKQYDSIQSYLKDSYVDGFVGAMYDINKKGIPLLMPIDQDQVVKAVQSDVKLSKGMYQAMGKYLAPLKKQVVQEISRGLAASERWTDIAARIERRSKIGLSNALRIARTEGHRVQNASIYDAQKAAKQSGVDIVKQWDATLDGNTRKDHRKLDGQIREIDEPFEVSGRKAMYPGKFGRAEQDINCRCTILQRAKWALDDDELEELKTRAEFFGLDKSDEFEDFKEKYLKATEEIKEIQESGINRKAQIYKSLETKHVDKIEELVNGADEIKKSVWLKFESKLKLNDAKLKGDAAYFKPSEGVNLNLELTFSGGDKQPSMTTWFHEFGHNIDYLTNNGYYSRKYKDGLFGKTIKSEVDARVKSIQKELRDKVKKEIENESITRDYLYDLYRKGMIGDEILSEVDQPMERYERLREKGDDETLKNEFFYSQDEIDFYKKQYDEAVEKAKKELIKRGSRKELAYKELEKEVRALTDAQKADLSDILEGATLAKIQAGWGHGKIYWRYSKDGVASEAFAEMFSAYMANPDSLETLKKYLPESVKVFDEMLAELAKE